MWSIRIQYRTKGAIKEIRAEQASDSPAEACIRAKAEIYALGEKADEVLAVRMVKVHE